MTPSVSVICTAKDAALTIEAALASVISQSLTDWEMVVVDDGSSDATADHIAQVVSQEPRIRLVRTDGIGRAAALNLAVTEARSELVANLDADDLFHPEHLRVVLAAFEGRSDFAAIGTDFTIIYEGETPDWCFAANEAQEAVVQDVTSNLLLHNPVCHSSIVIRESILHEVGGYDEMLPSQFDYNLWITLAANGYKIGCIPSNLVAKRIHSGQAYGAKNRLRYVLNSARVQARAIRKLNGRWHHWIVLAARITWTMRPRRSLRRVIGLVNGIGR